MIKRKYDQKNKLNSLVNAKLAGYFPNCFNCIAWGETS